jgi:hypothetical protein
VISALSAALMRDSILDSPPEPRAEFFMYWLAGALTSKEPKNPKIQQTLVLSVILEITKQILH